ncbi:hypothetical protein BU25DRAFT_1631 [Macroventuria anomochaeta]|uniref:Uncharacterized protein n=1 Tax=Macroventuria anomochaeta TaxID=301207 RepID=A0ACB6SG43_9PLEO|nr:uncharacterized protein BU25DRAFT_1631 [Macroventuria anomochaeta]KAF2633196.1 hypothetical protein BU25DRAFT_1631 [Macroventuria anomochaeta]
MPHNLRKKRVSNGRKSQRPSTPEQQSPLPEPDVGHTARDEQYNGIRIPFYDDPNHVAYGWQQMATLPDFPGLHTLVRGAQDDPPLSPGSRSRTWPVEPQRVLEQSGFNPHPRRGQGPRRPPPLAESEVRSEYMRGSRQTLKPFVDSSSTKPEVEGAGGGDSDRPGLASKDVNQKLRTGQSQASVSPLLKLTEDFRKVAQQPRSKGLTVDELESSHHPDKEAERMLPLPEEPSPLRVQKKRFGMNSTEPRPRSTTLERARMLRYPDSKHGHEGVKVTVHEVDEAEDKNVENLLTTAIAAWQLSGSAEDPLHEFEHRSAVPKPLDLAAIRAAKEQRKLSRQVPKSNDIPEGGERGSLYGAKIESDESFVTGTSSEFENLSMPESSEHNGTRRKWYKGFRRSE